MTIGYGKYFLYRHVLNSTGTPIYIGVGKKDNRTYSFKSVYYRAFNKQHRSDYWKRIMNKNKYKYSVDILIESDDYEFILKKEKEFICIYKRVVNGGTLVNHTDGGNANFINNIGAYNNAFKKVTYMYDLDGNFVKEFPSQSEAGRYIGKCDSYVFNSIKYNKNAGDFLFTHNFMGEKIKTDNFNIKRKNKPILKLDLFDFSIIFKYRSLKHAAFAEGVNHSSIFSAIKKHTICNGSFWLRESDYLKINEFNFKRRKPMEIVRIGEDGSRKNYDSIKNACTEFGVHFTSISMAIKNKKKSCGFFWETLNR